MRYKLIQTLLLILAFLNGSISNGNEYPLRYEIERCITQKINEEYPKEEGRLVEIRFLPEKTDSRIVSVVLGEAILTGAYSSEHYVIGVGGGIEPTNFAQGLLEAIDKFDDSDSISKLNDVTIVYYTHHAVFGSLRALTKKYGMKLIFENLDARSKSRLIESGC